MKVVRALIPPGIALLVAVGLLAAAGAPPTDALRALVEGSVGSTTKLSDTLMAWVPLVIASAGLVVTYSAGLWNIGVEGQVIAGGIFATAVARWWGGPGGVGIGLALAAGFVGGAVWGGLAGVLKTRGGVNEIFGGLGLTFAVQSLATYLIIGPWKRAGIASTSGTDLFDEKMWLPVVGSTRLSPVAVALAVVAVVAVWWLFATTRYGLELRAVGSNGASSRLVGLDPERTMLSAFLLGGGLAGLAGSMVVLGIQHKLVPAISGGRGYLAILVVLLAGISARWIGPIALFFAAISVGSSQLNLRFDLDSSLGGVLQGVVVLAAVLIGGWQAHRRTG